MYERFTDGARKVMQLADHEAQRFSHECIGTEHILLGLVGEGSGAAANILMGMQVGLLDIRLAVENVFRREPLLRTDGANTVIEYAVKEARRLHHNYVGTEHLLLGLLLEREGVGAQVLMKLGLQPGRVRALAKRQKRPAVRGRFQRFSDLTWKVIELANQAARRLHHGYVGTEHILLGLVEESSGGAASILDELRVGSLKIRIEVEMMLDRGSGVELMGKLPRTPRANKVIEYATVEARRLKQDYVGTEHLLLGLMTEEEGVAAQVLMNLGLRLDRVRTYQRFTPSNGRIHAGLPDNRYF